MALELSEHHAKGITQRTYPANYDLVRYLHLAVNTCHLWGLFKDGVKLFQLSSSMI